MKDFMKHNKWLILLIIIIPGLPILLNFFVFKPTCHLSVGKLQDWMSFWGSYLGATISAVVAFVILHIQRKDNKNDNKKNRNDNQEQNAKNRQILLNVFSYQQEMQWLGELRQALANHIRVYSENDVKEIINSVSSFSFESVQQKIKAICDNLALTDTVLTLVISGSPQGKNKNAHMEKMKELYKRYISTITDFQFLIHLYYKKIPMASNTNECILQLASDLLKDIVKENGVNPQSLGYNEFAEIAHQLIKPLPSIFEEARVLSLDWIKEESERINSLLREER